MYSVPAAISFIIRTRSFWWFTKSRILSSTQYSGSLFAWAKKARACSSTVSPDSPPIKSKNCFSLRGYCFFVVGDLTDIKAKSTGVVWRDIASFSLLLLLLLLSLSLMTYNVCFL